MSLRKKQPQTLAEKLIRVQSESEGALDLFSTAKRGLEASNEALDVVLNEIDSELIHLAQLKQDSVTQRRRNEGAISGINTILGE